MAELAAFYHAQQTVPGTAARPADAAARDRRFAELVKVGDLAAATVGEYGCGRGDLLAYLRASGFAGEYRGYDMVPSVAAAARARHATDTKARFAADEALLAGVEFVLADGVFHLKLDAPVSDWEANLRLTLGRLAAHARRGFAFNALSNKGDPKSRRPECYHADAARLLDYCRRAFSRDVTLLEGYGLDEFTILVRR